MLFAFDSTGHKKPKMKDRLMTNRNQKQLLSRLRRIEGQIRGIQRMIESDRYCIDILTQTASIISALKGVEDQLMEQHLNTCVTEAITSNDTIQQREKMDEVMTVISKFRKHG